MEIKNNRYGRMTIGPIDPDKPHRKMEEVPIEQVMKIDAMCAGQHLVFEAPNGYHIVQIFNDNDEYLHINCVSYAEERLLAFKSKDAHNWELAANISLKDGDEDKATCINGCSEHEHTH